MSSYPSAGIYTIQIHISMQTFTCILYPFIISPDNKLIIYVHKAWWDIKPLFLTCIYGSTAAILFQRVTAFNWNALFCYSLTSYYKGMHILYSMGKVCVCEISPCIFSHQEKDNLSYFSLLHTHFTSSMGRDLSLNRCPSVVTWKVNLLFVRRRRAITAII